MTQEVNTAKQHVPQQNVIEINTFRYPFTGLDTHLWILKAEAPRIYRQSAHEDDKAEDVVRSTKESVFMYLSDFYKTDLTGHFYVFKFWGW